MFVDEFVSQRSRIRKQSSLSSCAEDNITPRMMEWCNFSESASKLDNISTQKIESFETVYKEIQNLFAEDLSESDNKVTSHFIQFNIKLVNYLLFRIT